MMLHNEIKAQLETTFSSFALKMFLKIDDYLGESYYESKAKRVAELRGKGKSEIEKWIVAIIASVVHKTSTQTIQEVVGYIAGHLPHEDPFDNAKTAAELLALGSQPGGFYEIVRRGPGLPAIIQVNKWDLIQKKLLHMFSWINDTLFNPPLIEPPKEVTNNHSCGYHTITEPCILGRHTQHSGKICLDTINTLNSIEWVLDPDVLAEQERPAKPPATPEAHQQFIDMARQSRRLYKSFKDKVFWLVWQADSRGRYYSHGYHINLQSQEYKKALLSFNREEVLS